MLLPMPRFSPLWERPRLSFSAVSRAVFVCHFGKVYTRLYASIVVDVCSLCIACVNNYHAKGFESSFCW